MANRNAPIKRSTAANQHNWNQHLSSNHLNPSIEVTNFNLVSLIDQNNLSDDSCLIVVDFKVYDLTLWIQDRLSCNQPSPNSHHSRATALYSDHSSSHPSPPPSPAVTKKNVLLSDAPQPNPFDRLLAQAKIDPVQAGHLLKSTYDQEPRRSDRTTRLEDWIHEYRIGDFSAADPNTSGSSSRNQHQALSSPQIIPFNDPVLPAPTATRTIHSHLTQTYAQSASSDLAQSRRTTVASHTSASSTFTLQQPQASSYGSNPTGSRSKRELDRSGGERNLSINGSESSSISSHATIQGSSSVSQPSSTRRPAAAHPDHLKLAREALQRAQQQVADAQLGVGVPSISLGEAWEQLAKAQMIIDFLIQEAAEGVRPCWNEWKDNSR